MRDPGLHDSSLEGAGFELRFGARYSNGFEASSELELIARRFSRAVAAVGYTELLASETRGGAFPLHPNYEYECLTE
jgi:hypothetical protein